MRTLWKDCVITPNSRECMKCRVIKPNSEFPSQKNRRGKWIRHTCRGCFNAHKREYNKTPSSKLQRRSYYIANKPRLITQRHEFYMNNKEHVKAVNGKWYAKNPKRVWAIQTLKSHKRRGMTVEISIEQLLELAKSSNECVICGIAIDWSQGKKRKARPNSPTLDRTNNETLLTLATCQIVCYRCNTTKGNRTMIEFIDYCKNVVARHG